MKNKQTKQTSILSSADLKTAYGKTLYGICYLLLAIVTVFSVVPALWTLLTSLKDTQEIYKTFTFFPHDLSPSHAAYRIQESWRELQLGSSILNTVYLSIGSCIIKIIVCGFGGYVLSRLKPKGTKLIFTLVVWTMMMPGQIRIVPTYISYLHFPFAYDIGGISLLDTYWPMWLSAAGDTFALLLFKNSFDALSMSYVESAKLDGCGNFGVFFKIMLPLSSPIIIYESINTLSRAWSDFFLPLLVLDKHAVLPLKIYQLSADTSIKMNTYFMGLVIASMPPFLIFLIFNKHIQGGINIGGVKG